MPRRILTIEDDAAIRRGIRDTLRCSGFEVLESADGMAGLEAAIARSYDLLLLDLVLPGCSGLEILRRMREVHPTLPVIILSAKGEEADRVRGLRGGADDYVVKPFGAAELIARVEAVLRRSPARPIDISRLTFPGGYVDFARGEVVEERGAVESLTEREAEVLRYLAMHSSRAVSRDELLVGVWKIDPRGCGTRVVDMTVSRLREKLRDDPREPRLIRTARGKGYTLGTEIRIPDADTP